MAFPYEDYDPAALGRTRIRSLRKRKARALLASPYEKYADLGKNLMREVEEEIEQDRRRAEAEVEAALRAQGLSRQEARDAAEDAYRAEQMAFAREREVARDERADREFAQRQREFDERLGLQGRTLEQRAAEARAMRELRERQLAQRGAAGVPGEPPEAGAPPGGEPPEAGAEPPSDDEFLPETTLPGKPPVFKQKAVTESAAAIVRLNRAYRMLERTPGAYGAANQALGLGAAAAGGVPALGHALGPLATSLTQRGMTKEEREVRNEVDSLVDEAIKAISGGQVTQYEDLRKTYLPRPYDSAPIVKDKIRGMFKRAADNYRAYGGLSEVKVPDDDAGESAPDVDVDDIVNKYLGAKPARPGLMRSH